jgi:hypothetical protein
MARFRGGQSHYLTKKAREYSFLSDLYKKGLQGEDIAAAELKHLSNEYVVLRSINTNFGDIDFIVLGPTGIFTIEAKHWSGKIGLEKSYFTSNGHIVQRDIVAHAKISAAWLQKLLTGNSQGHLKVNPIIVFTDPDAKYLFQTGPVNGVQILETHQLSQFIEKHGIVYIDMKVAEKIIKEYCYPISHKVMQRILPPQAKFVGGHMNLCSNLTGFNIHEA